MKEQTIKRAALAVALIAVLGCASGAGSGSGDSIRASREKPGLDDVEIKACRVSSNQFLGYESTVKVTNNSSKTSNYMITVVVQSDDGSTQLETINFAVQRLDPGQSTEQTEPGGSRDKVVAGESFTCKVSDVTRYAA